MHQSVFLMLILRKKPDSNTDFAIAVFSHVFQNTVFKHSVWIYCGDQSFARRVSAFNSNYASHA